MNVRAVYPALQLRPIALDSVGARAVVRRVLAFVMADGHVVEAEHVQTTVAAKLVGRDGRLRGPGDPHRRADLGAWSRRRG